MGGRVGPGVYRERLNAPWWAHPVVVAISVVVGLESSFLAGGLVGQSIVVLLFVLAGELTVWRYGSRVVEVSGGHVRAGRWRLPIGQVRAVAVLDARHTKEEMRRRDDELYRCTRGWVPTAVLLDVDDPDDLPMWLVSTRHPHLLAAALTAAAQAAVDEHAARATAGSEPWTRTPGAP